MEKQIRIALAGNPNCGKTTLFNALTGSNQFVGNWPGVTVEKKEGKLKKHDDVIIMDLPGIYSLSPYTLEEVVARNYLITERPDAILNIIDGTNLERNLYLTTQLTELGIPVVIAINMMDVVRKNGDQINVAELSRELGCEIVEISALKGDGVMQAAEAAVKAAKSGKTIPMHTFSGPVEHAIAHIEEAAVHNMPEEQQRWYAIKIFERDDKVLEKLTIPAETMQHIESDIKAAEAELDDDAESIITNERYVYIAQIIKGCYKKKNHGQLSASDKIDKIVTNRWLGLPIFAVVMFLVYWVAMVGVGAPATDWANDGLFGQNLGMEPIFFVAEPKYFRGVLVLSDLWKSVGWGSIVYLAAVTSVDPTLYEAAEMDGAGRIKKIIHVTIPALAPIITVMFIMESGKILNDSFEQVYNFLTPSTYAVGDVISTFVYRMGIQKMQYSFTTAVDLFKNIISFMLVVMTNYIARKTNDYALW